MKKPPISRRSHYNRAKVKYSTLPPITEKSDKTEPKPLFLIMQKKWFDEILSGRKKIEYRDDTQFYRSRLAKDGKFRNYKSVVLQVGYNADAQRMTVEVKNITLDDCFEIHLGEIIEKNFS